MKVTIQLFAFYMLALSLLPCGDGGGGVVVWMNHLLEVEQTISSDHDHHSKDCGDDTCSPFCICNCCSIAVNVPINTDLIFKFYPLLVGQEFFTFDDKLSSIFHPFIWQPPTIP